MHESAVAQKHEAEVENSKSTDDLDKSGSDKDVSGADMDDNSSSTGSVSTDQNPFALHFKEIENRPSFSFFGQGDK